MPEQVLVFAHVAGVDEAGEHSHVLRGRAFGGQIFDKSRHHVAEARDV